jgi:hypothetical protein
MIMIIEFLSSEVCKSVETQKMKSFGAAVLTDKIVVRKEPYMQKDRQADDCRYVLSHC